MFFILKYIKSYLVYITFLVCPLKMEKDDKIYRLRETVGRKKLTNCVYLDEEESEEIVHSLQHCGFCSACLGSCWKGMICLSSCVGNKPG